MTLDQWLVYLEKLHPSSIELGLDRIRQVAGRLDLDRGGRKVITVGGTNGKGSCIALLEQVLTAGGRRCGAYTSPHLLRYNERVRVDGRQASDAALCEAFEAVEQARGGVSLTYFEFGTLAALWHFGRQALDYLLLEVGLGGRLDAVNIVAAEVALVTNVALDHMDWLGDTREQIGHEKAGIYRPGRPALYGERDMPASVEQHARDVGAIPYRQGAEFGWELAADPLHIHCRGRDAAGEPRDFADLPVSQFAPDNVASVVQALLLVEPDLAREALLRGLRRAVVPGRFQVLERGGHTVLLDVAHNPHAAANLHNSLRREFPGRRFQMVIGMLKDKDSAGVLELLLPLDARWHVAEIEGERGSTAEILYNQLLRHGAAVSRHAGVAEAFAAAEAQAGPDDVVVVTGSFFTVSGVLEALEREGRAA